MKKAFISFLILGSMSVYADVCSKDSISKAFNEFKFINGTTQMYLEKAVSVHGVNALGRAFRIENNYNNGVVINETTREISYKLDKDFVSSIESDYAKSKMIRENTRKNLKQNEDSIDKLGLYISLCGNHERYLKKAWNIFKEHNEKKLLILSKLDRANLSYDLRLLIEVSDQYENGELIDSETKRVRLLVEKREILEAKLDAENAKILSKEAHSILAEDKSKLEQLFLQIPFEV